MRIFNFGSLNIDHVYRVSTLVAPGETCAATDYHQYCGGKGLNQSIALARAGASVCHVGVIGKDGQLLLQQLASDGVDVSLVEQIDGASGHAVIQVSDQGENAIIVFAGANQQLQPALIERALDCAAPEDWVLCQNETSQVDYIIRAASERGLKLACNPAPMTTSALEYPYHLLDLLLLNQTEAQQLTGASQRQQIIDRLQAQYPNTTIVLTLGAEGAICIYQQHLLRQAAEVVKAVDSTAAGDTFTGYFLHAWSQQRALDVCLQQASHAAALCVQQAGAAQSIP
ncbi:MAG: ribokinase [Gammaproteobacteria bacterium]|nr:ribokinase [Gammaproteobacteria bacterium]